MLVYYFVPFIVSNRYLIFRDLNGHNSVTVQNRTHVYMNFFDHKDLGNHLLQLCPKVVKHPVYRKSNVNIPFGGGGATSQIESRPPHILDFQITHTYITRATCRSPLESLISSTHKPLPAEDIKYSGIRTRNPSNQAPTDLCHIRPRK